MKWAGRQDWIDGARILVILKFGTNLVVIILLLEKEQATCIAAWHFRRAFRPV